MQTTRRPGRLPTSDVLQQHRRDGWTYEQIAQEYGVTRQGVHVALARGHLVTSERRDYSDKIPWKIRPEDRNSNVLRMLRAAAASEAGHEMSERRRMEVTTWLRGMETPEEWAPLGWVIAYDPSRWPESKGFHKLPRHPDDVWLVRV